uniref:Phospholipid scramblase n=2 Tax=Pseudictyota dubia TaxID=2749911 RepID=A0A7R9Z6R5_9STRA|mmetsp:Transcript_25261/g.46959  ORF Transcript_25261/g.46959 Transcript_25261/m.46959 type:complete len:307 (+) Transcript_25261:797-1717(+)
MSTKNSAQVAPNVALSVDLSSIPGVVIHQRAQPGEAIAQALGVPYEAKNEYVVSPMPEGESVASSSSDPKLWKPSLEDLKALPELFVMKEDSDCGTRILFTLCGCRAMRPMNVRIIERGADTSTSMTKPCKCGGWICCPLEMTVAKEGEGRIGTVRENFNPYCSKCCECCFKCSYYHNVYPVADPKAPSAISMDRSSGGGLGEPKYELKFNVCCCGENNNCCGATCFNHHAIFNIRDPSSGAVLGNIQKLFAPSTSGGGDACCRMLYGYDTFAVGFPEGTSHEERLTILAGILQAEFQLYEADQDN